MCYYPKLIKNKKYTSTKKNGGEIPVVNDERAKYVAVGCGKCQECRRQYARNWQVRLLEEIKDTPGGKFITLTFSDKHIALIDQEIDRGILGYDRDNAIATYAVRHFLERWRKKYKKSLRHFLITELGHNGTENIHLHGIVWTDQIDMVEKLWSYGWVWKGKKVELGGGKVRYDNYVNESTISYMTKYITKVDEKHTQYKSKVLTSPGIGARYIHSQDAKQNIYKGDNTKTTYRTRTGHKVALPIYWRNKLYTDDEREELWMGMLDKEVRYVNKQKISIKDGEDEYWKALAHQQKINKELGYGGDETNWEQEQYERERRIALQKERIEKGRRR